MVTFVFADKLSFRQVKLDSLMLLAKFARTLRYPDSGGI